MAPPQSPLTGDELTSAIALLHRLIPEEDFPAYSLDSRTSCSNHPAQRRTGLSVTSEPCDLLPMRSFRTEKGEASHGRLTPDDPNRPSL